MFCRSIKLDPRMSDAWYNVGALYDMLDQTEDAQKAYFEAKENGLAERFIQSGINININVLAAGAVATAGNREGVYNQSSEERGFEREALNSQSSKLHQEQEQIQQLQHPLQQQQQNQNNSTAIAPRSLLRSQRVV